jgi:hypothetical protein
VPARTPPRSDHSASVGPPAFLIEVECHLRLAGRLLEHVGVSDTESARLAAIVFRLASRVRSDRLAVTA